MNHSVNIYNKDIKLLCSDHQFISDANHANSTTLNWNGLSKFEDKRWDTFLDIEFSTFSSKTGDSRVPLIIQEGLIWLKLKIIVR